MAAISCRRFPLPTGGSEALRLENSNRLRRAVEQADRSGVLNLDALQRAIDRMPARKGTAKLRSILADYAGPVLTRSGFERRFLERDRLRDARLQRAR